VAAEDVDRGVGPAQSKPIARVAPPISPAQGVARGLLAPGDDDVASGARVVPGELAAPSPRVPPTTTTRHAVESVS
jgi:hypothetical protein